MKALPLWQPWATLVANGRKRIETRSWPAPRYVLGERIAIHATKGGLRRNQELELLATPEFFGCLWSEVPDTRFADVTANSISWVLPRGALIATAVIDRCLPIDRSRARALAAATSTEYIFGDYTPGRYAWVLRDVERLPEPIPFKGSQGIFDVPDELLGVAPIQPGAARGCRVNARLFAVLVALLIAANLLVHAATASAKCRTRACWKRVHHARAEHWCHRHAACVWHHRWLALPAWERGWARCVATWETRGVPWHLKATVATGNGYYGSTQWLPATWHAAGGSGLPTQHTLSEQLVRTVWWARRESPRQWSTSARCGR